MEKNKYKQIVEKNKPKENRLMNGTIAFVVGGLMGMLGEFLVQVYSYYFDISTKHFESEGKTVGGWAMEQLQKILEPGDTFEYKNIAITIKEIADQRVTKVIIKLNKFKEIN